MKIEDQVCSLEQAKKLKELGIEQNTEFTWVCVMPDPVGEQWYYVPAARHDTRKEIENAENLAAAFTVAELGVMLPLYYSSYVSDNRKSWYCLKDGTQEDYSKYEFTESKTEAQARALMLIHLLENEIEAEEVNSRLTP